MYHTPTIKSSFFSRPARRTRFCLFARCSRPTLRGFTLLETTMVIAVIALLITLFLPSLFRSRAAALETRMLSNMRQLAIAFTTYADSHAGIMAAIFSPEFRIQGNPERVIMPDGQRGGGYWFSNTHTAWMLAAPDFTEEMLHAAGHPAHIRPRDRFIYSDFHLSEAFYASPAYWNMKTITGPKQWASQRLDAVAYPDRKAMLMPIENFLVPNFPDGTISCCRQGLPIAVAWSDLSASSIMGDAVLPGSPNPWHHLTHRGFPSWAGGTPLWSTKDGIFGRDR